jgi:hypothetical protein
MRLTTTTMTVILLLRRSDTRFDHVLAHDHRCLSMQYLGCSSTFFDTRLSHRHTGTLDIFLSFHYLMYSLATRYLVQVTKVSPMGNTPPTSSLACI